MESNPSVSLPAQRPYRRVSFFAGPGCGKSTMAYRAMSFLKSKAIECEFVSEYVKDWTYIKQKPGGFDQVFLFATQLRKEDILLRSGVNVVVTESPPFLAICYGIRNGLLEVNNLNPILNMFNSIYPSLNIVIKRKGAKYSSLGRYETPKEAVEMDELIVRELSGRAKFIELDFGDFQGLEDYLQKVF